ncbi:MAG: 16S rRNA (cytosine(967)-C(5))-methyltransferase RsmB [Agathobacter sp.]
MTTDVNTRSLALEMLMEVNEKGQYSHLILRQVLEKYQYLDKKERAFLTRLFEGTVEKGITLDYVINCFSKTRVQRMKPLIRNLLRMSVYQLLYMDGVPDCAAINEAVKLARKRGFSGLSGFVNGVLRSVARGKNNITWPQERKNPIEAFSVCYSVPEWIVEEWMHDYGRDKTVAILEGLSGETVGAAGAKGPKETLLPKSGLTVRTNLNRCTPEELRERLESEGIQVEEIPGIPYAFALSGIDYLAGLNSFAEGLFYVQDVSSMMVAQTAGPRPGDYVIDVCAAPGGKSTHMAELMQGTGMVEARDLTEYKVGLIEENRIRHGLTNLRAVQMDALVYDGDSHEKADVLVCDLPCSGLGVMAKKTDIRYKMTKEKAGELVLLQRQILDVVCDYVKPGGILLYSTCTIRKAENEDNVHWFLAKHPEFSLETMRQMYPGETGNDGFFLAKMEKKA